MIFRRAFFALAITNFLAPVSGHTQLLYPIWRDNALNPPYDERIYPCAGTVDNATTPRTPWPLDGGSLNITLKDGAALIFVNLGLGVNVTNFNISLSAFPLNETGAGNICFPKLTLPPGLPISEGSQASIQVTTSNPKNGAGLYTCADIVFTSNATVLPSDQCANSSNVALHPLFGSSTSNPPAGSPSGTSKASNVAVFIPTLLTLICSCLFAVMLL